MAYTFSENLLQGYTHYLNGWAKKGFFDKETKVLGGLCFGLTTYSVKRALVLQFKTPGAEAFAGMGSKQIIQVKVALYRDKPGVDDWYSNISTTAPDFTKSSNA